MDSSWILQTIHYYYERTTSSKEDDHGKQRDWRIKGTEAVFNNTIHINLLLFLCGGLLGCVGGRPETHRADS